MRAALLLYDLRELDKLNETLTFVLASVNNLDNILLSRRCEVQLTIQNINCYDYRINTLYDVIEYKVDL